VEILGIIEWEVVYSSVVEHPEIRWRPLQVPLSSQGGSTSTGRRLADADSSRRKCCNMRWILGQRSGSLIDNGQDY